MNLGFRRDRDARGPEDSSEYAVAVDDQVFQRAQRMKEQKRNPDMAEKAMRAIHETVERGLGRHRRCDDEGADLQRLSFGPRQQ